MTVTVFTPTYNRGYIIKNLYDSLCRQTCKDFEWVVIDDGSTDNTEELFNSFISESNGFDIVYRKVSNGGKMRAVNKGVKMASGEVFLCIDSDDYLFDDAVENITKWLNSIDHDCSKYVGVSGHRAHFDGTIIGTSFPEEYRDFMTYERDKNNLTGDQSEVYFTSIIKKYPFPEYDGEKFIPEGPTMMNMCFQEQKPFRFFNKPICYCEYREDGYTHNNNSYLKNNVRGLIYNAKLEVKITRPSFVKKLKLYHLPYISAKLTGWTDRQFRKEMNIPFIEYFIVAVSHFALTRVVGRKY